MSDLVFSEGGKDQGEKEQVPFSGSAPEKWRANRGRWRGASAQDDRTSWRERAARSDRGGWRGGAHGDRGGWGGDGGRGGGRGSWREREGRRDRENWKEGEGRGDRGNWREGEGRGDRGSWGGEGQSSWRGGAGRGGGHSHRTSRDSQDSREGHEDSADRGAERGRGGGRGRGRGGRFFTDEQRTEIVVAARPLTLQVAGEGTDDIIVAKAADEKLQHLASFILRKTDFHGFTGQRMIHNFVDSCLLNLSNHHNIDTSGVLGDLASTSGRARLSEILSMPMEVDAELMKDVLPFQTVVIPLVGILTRESLCQSTMTTECGLIYSTVYQHRKTFLEEGLLHCMDKLLKTRILWARISFLSPGSPRQEFSLQRAFLGIVRLVYQLIKRIRDARFEMADIVKRLYEQQTKCIEASDSSNESRFLNEILVRDVLRIRNIVADAQASFLPSVSSSAPTLTAILSRIRGPNLPYLHLMYDPPGTLSRNGPRHDNDHAEIASISIIPTEAELTCSRQPFLPSNGIDAPHHWPQGWKRQIDIHFRLYREDMLYSFRDSVNAFFSALEKTAKGNEDALLKQKAIDTQSGNSNVNMDVYGGVRFRGLECEGHARGALVISFTQPSQVHGAKERRRKEFWERSKSRLMQGSLICLAGRSWHSSGGSTFHTILAVVERRDVDALSMSESNAFIHVKLTDPQQYMTFLNPASAKSPDMPDRWFLVQSKGGFFESYRPVLKSLQNCEPAILPFGKYIAPTEHEYNTRLDAGGKVDPPLYARAPGFTFDLSVLVKDKRLRLDAADPQSIDNAVHMLQRESTLDDTQASALVETLCREVALISGPPGTGKTKIGVDLMRVLLHNKQAMNCGPILCICYTNHALDQFLEHLLDMDVTDIVRIGSRSNSKRLEMHKLETKMRSNDLPDLVRRTLAATKNEWEGTWNTIEGLVKNIMHLETATQSRAVSWNHIDDYLQTEDPDQWEQLRPRMAESYLDDDDFTTVLHKGQHIDHFSRWINGHDISEKQKLNEQMKKWKDQKQHKFYNSYSALASKDEEEGEEEEEKEEELELWDIPLGDRPLRMLGGDVWEMSMVERRRLLDSWRPKAQESMIEQLTEHLREAEEFAKKKNEAYDEARRCILQNASVIGMTTSGAAKMQALISAVAPEIIICEEAGEVLESHILTALSPSTQHLILIGDHKQLRPQIETYTLSSDSTVGKNYNLDQSLFERLVTAEKNPLPLSHMTIQRRMRPEISSLIRNTLYPDLVDEKRVLEYPNVSGMGANLYFMDHAHAEDSRDQYGMQSFANSFEVRMVGALAQYLIKNGYDKPGDIAVLTPYLGQLSKLRDGLSDAFKLLIDERDQEKLDQGEQDAEVDGWRPKPTSEPAKQESLTLRTIDNYQGEEAKIVIISLVRSDIKESGEKADWSSIGFLKSPNRTNVLLSRAQHGMYLIGNAGLMAQEKHGLWPKIMEELRASDRVGGGFAITCKEHGIASTVSDAETFKAISPNGGCTAMCDYRLSCGHTCPMQCHPYDKEHVSFKCPQPCPHLHKGCNHVCPKTCGEVCGDCMEVVADIVLSCGHVFKQPRCYQAKDLARIYCKVSVVRKLPSCEHEKTMVCQMDPKGVLCSEKCGTRLECGHYCLRNCSECQKTSPSPEGEGKSVEGIPRTVHGGCLTKCGQIQLCGHTCQANCHEGSSCPACTQQCKAACAHSRCRQKCTEPCDVCCQPCVWSCQHQGQCNMPCGVPCDRLPCNKRCEKLLKCGHRCPSVCGETCPSTVLCIECKKDPAEMDELVDLLREDSFSEVDVDRNPILVLGCGHVLTMLTLDGLMEMDRYYVEYFDREHGAIEYVGRHDLPGYEPDQVLCPICDEPAVGPLRYGLRLNHLLLAARLRSQHIDQFQGFDKVHKQFAKVCDEVESRRTKVLEQLSKTKRESRMDPPKAFLRVLGNFENKADYYPNSDFAALPPIYKIPVRYRRHWTELVGPAVEVFQSFLRADNGAGLSPLNRLYDAIVGHFKRTASSSTSGQPQKVRALDVDCGSAVKCGFPRGGSTVLSKVESLYGQASVLLLVLSLAFSFLDEAGVASGWYWFVEDLIRCTMIYAGLLIEAAQEGMYRRKVAYARLMRIELICMTLQWIGMEHVAVGPKAKAKRSKQVKRLLKNYMTDDKEIREKYAWVITIDIKKRMVELRDRMVSAVRAARGEDVFVAVSQGEKLRYLFKGATDQEPVQDGQWVLCSNGHGYVLDESTVLMEWRCFECQVSIAGY